MKLALKQDDTNLDYFNLHKINLKDEDFTQLAKILLEISGINLPDSLKNKSLMSGRLAPILRELKLDNYGGYLDLIANPSATELRSRFVSAMTTNTTEFFREGKHFELLAQKLPELLLQKQKRGLNELRVWCSAASTGQEPYSILITLLEQMPQFSPWEIKFLATDIDMDVLRRAAAGQYRENEITNVPQLLRSKYFISGTRSKSGLFTIKPEYRKMIRFAPFNLVSDAYRFQFKFDIIFCRNVLIYFNRATSVDVVNNLANALAPSGLLFVGHAETSAMKGSGLEAYSHAAYKKWGSK